MDREVGRNEEGSSVKNKIKRPSPLKDCVFLV